MQNRTREITMMAVFIAMVFVATNIRILIPVALGTGGLVHLGTLVMFAIALKYGKVFGAVAGGVGMMLFDLFSEWAIWAPGTLVVRLLAGFVIGYIAYSQLGQGKSAIKNVIALLLGSVIIIVGYFIFEAVFLGVGWVAVGSIPGNVVQIVIGFFALWILPSLPDLKEEV